MFWFGRGLARHFKKQKEKKISPTEYLILSTLNREGDKSASDIIELLERQFKGFWKPKAGTIYPILTKLESKNFIQSQGSYPKKYYITEEGKKQINFLASIFNNEIKFFEKFAQFVTGNLSGFSMIDNIFTEKLVQYRNWLKEELKRVENILLEEDMKEDKDDSTKEKYNIPIK
ncbi:MAG: hypothetical protein GF329_02130 [Candidatus Lokiarchaeota archaeon]|nr:hypothetical protein [Candidatus Lokiarchaeota archaeon]